MEDFMLIDLFFERSEQAITALMEQYGGVMHTIGYNILQNTQDAEECVNDACLGVWNAIPPARPHPLYAFVCRITRNQALTRYHHYQAAKRDRKKNLSLEEIGDVIPDRFGIDQAMEQAEITRALNDWLETLSVGNRYIFIRRYWYMDSVEKVRKTLHLSSAAVYLRIGRMKKNLREYLRERGVFQ